MEYLVAYLCVSKPISAFYRGKTCSAREFLKKKIRFGIKFDTDTTLTYKRNTVTDGRANIAQAPSPKIVPFADFFLASVVY